MKIRSICGPIGLPLLPILFIASFLLSHGEVAHADTVLSPFQLKLTAPSTLALLGGIQIFKAPVGQLKTDLPNQTLTTPYTVAISGIHLTLDYAFQTPVQNGSLSEWTIQSQNLGADLLVDRIDATQIIVEHSGGTTINIELKASCSAVHLQLAPESTHASATVDLSLAQGRAQFKLKDFTANWTPSAWQILSLNCTGPTGFTELARQQIALQLQSINPFLGPLQNEIQSQLNQASREITDWNLNPNDDSGINIDLKPENLNLTSDGGALVSGLALFDFTKLHSTACQSKLETLSAPPTSADMLFFPKAAVQKLITCAFLNHNLKAQIPGSAFPSFQSLLSNWFLKVIVWPNLVHFNRNSDFQFTFSTEALPQIGELTDPGDQSIAFDLELPLKIAVTAPTENGHEHYIDFFSNLAGQAYLYIENGSLWFQQGTNVPLDKVWDQNYFNAHGGDQRICLSLMGHQFKSLIAKTGLSFTLPTWTVRQAFSLAANSLFVQGDDIAIGLDIKTLPLLKR